MAQNIEYIAAGGNRHPAVADWDEKSGLVAYGADRNIALWFPQVCLIHISLFFQSLMNIILEGWYSEGGFLHFARI